MYVVLSNHGFLPDASPITGAVQLQPLMAGCLGGHGTATIKREQNGTYTSSRGNPTKLVHSDTARITFDLEPDEFDPSVLNATSATVTWELTETQTETFDDCVEVTESTGSGGWSADNGPGVMYGWSAPDGTLFGMVPDESKYVFEAVPPVTDIPTDDLRVAYESSTTGCGITLSGLRVPFTTLAYADAPMPTDPTTLSGTYQRTMQGGLLLVPMQVTVVWNISLVPAGSP
jgi:hypothetical protein